MTRVTSKALGARLLQSLNGVMLELRQGILVLRKKLIGHLTDLGERQYRFIGIDFFSM